MDYYTLGVLYGRKTDLEKTINRIVKDMINISEGSNMIYIKVENLDKKDETFKFYIKPKEAIEILDSHLTEAKKDLEQCIKDINQHQTVTNA